MAPNVLNAISDVPIRQAHADPLVERLPPPPHIDIGIMKALDAGDRETMLLIAAWLAPLVFKKRMAHLAADAVEPRISRSLRPTQRTKAVCSYEGTMAMREAAAQAVASTPPSTRPGLPNGIYFGDPLYATDAVQSSPRSGVNCSSAVTSGPSPDRRFFSIVKRTCIHWLSLLDELRDYGIGLAHDVAYRRRSLVVSPRHGRSASSSAAPSVAPSFFSPCQRIVGSATIMAAGIREVAIGR